MSLEGPTPAVELPPGSLLGGSRYCVTHEINRGATAVVYAAADNKAASEGAMVALKVMSGMGHVPSKVVKQEIAFSKAVQHANVVRMLDVFVGDVPGPAAGRLVIVWELVEGPDLLELVIEQGGRLIETQAAFFFLQLLHAVLYMHQNGFTHRDIKPENCVVDRGSQRLKVCDFGLSKHLESVKTRAIGTPDYLAPEMLQKASSGGSPGRHGPAYDARAVDAWAMGSLLFLLVTGEYPFQDARHPYDLTHTIRNVLAGRMRPLPDHVSPGCQALIASLLRRDPAKRARLQDLAGDVWLRHQAMAHAVTTGRLDVLPAQIAATMAAPIKVDVPVEQRPALPQSYAPQSDEVEAGSGAGGVPPSTTTASSYYSAGASDEHPLPDQGTGGTRHVGSAQQPAGFWLQRSMPASSSQPVGLRARTLKGACSDGCTVV